MNEDGTESNLDGAAAKEVYAIWRELNEAGAVAPGAPRTRPAPPGSATSRRARSA